MAYLQSIFKISLISKRQDIINFCKKVLSSDYSVLIQQEITPAILEISTIVIIDAGFFVQNSDFLKRFPIENGYKLICLITPDICRETLGLIEASIKNLLFYPVEPAVIKNRISSIIEQRQNAFTALSPVFTRLPVEDNLLGFFEGESDCIKKVRYKIKELSQNSLSIIILGESGTGKSTAAKTIHKLSSRKNKPIQRINMGSIVPTLAETTFFGCVKGSYTDAITTEGIFSKANEGTLILDEIGMTPYKVQGILLTILEEGFFNIVGTPESCKVDVRIISCTNEDIKKLTYKKEFRLDLLSRLSDDYIIMPSLRDRKEDIPYICRSFEKEKNVYFTPTAIEKLQNYNWPVNVKELHQCLTRAAKRASSTGGNIQPENIEFGLFNDDFELQFLR